MHRGKNKYFEINKLQLKEKITRKIIKYFELNKTQNIKDSKSDYRNVCRKICNTHACII